ncbi:hypothetical protein TrLO_g9968 [Triparma laevis f. longispina]|uniref:Uncharacterized protein n=2 Tax=Triparma laevis TaxID=1534972 RepID=A0A9W6ZEU0_9STRA|nr:hypothetical protein TrLO_g9968 [Triparma laevis f. longispina]
MVRVFIKGGVWKNSEDEILKAAVMKYGKQNWDRVASLLNRKSGKQCKSRWFEWLDPSVKKIEWSRSEEEKLLHLAKLMPAQWRTIAPIVGRTAAQCQEKYELLLDAAASNEQQSGLPTDPDGEGKDASTKGQRNVRVGEIDTHPETKPARPDPIDMDEDEIEMLQEARARLANTQGKKAKRKGREKMLAEAKRLADLQKRRELKAAGIISGKARTTVSRKKRKEIDYGVEIPFHKPAPAGFHSVSTEKETTTKIQEDKLRDIDFGKVNEQNMRTRDRENQDAKKKEAQRIKALEKANMQLVVQQVSQANDPLSFRARGTLSMPEPSVSDSELSQVAKMSSQMMLPPPSRTSGNAATNALLGDYSDRPLPTPMRTPAGSEEQNRSDVIMQEAINQRKMNSGQTPLFGDENPELGTGTGYEGAEPSKAGVTPGMTPGGDASVNASVMSHMTGATGVNETPGGGSLKRDQFGLNNRRGAGGDGEDFNDTASFASFASSVRSSAKEQRRAAKKARLDLANALAALPTPQFEYEIAAPVEEDEEGNDGVTDMEEDQEDVENRLAEIKKLETEMEFAARTSVVKRVAELPKVVDFDKSAVGEDEVGKEMLALLNHDAQKYSKKRKNAPASLENIPLKNLEEAKALLTKEGESDMVKDANKLNVSVEDLGGIVAAEILKDAEGMIFVEGKGWLEKAGKGDLVNALKYEYSSIAGALEVLEKKTTKMTKKLEKKMGGYAKKCSVTGGLIKAAYDDVELVKIEKAVYSRLGEAEAEMLSKRIGGLKGEVDGLEKVQNELQGRWAELHA